MKKYMIVALILTLNTGYAVEGYVGFYGGSNTAPNVVNGEYSEWASFGGIVGISHTHNGFYTAADMTLNDESPVFTISAGIHINDIIATMGIGYGEESISHQTGFAAPFDPYVELHDSYTLYFIDVEKSGFFARYSLYDTKYSDLLRRITAISPRIKYGVEHFYSKTHRSAIQLGYRYRF